MLTDTQRTGLLRELDLLGDKLVTAGMGISIDEALVIGRRSLLVLRQVVEDKTDHTVAVEKLQGEG